MFRYKAFKKNQSKVAEGYPFELSDCPALLWDDAFFLVGKPESPVLLLNTVVRGHPTQDLFEGDRVIDRQSKKEIGVVVYDNGFFMQKVGDPVKKCIPTGHIYLRKGDMASIASLEKFERTPISFKYLNIVFDFGDLVSIDGEALSLIIAGKPQKVNLKWVTSLLYHNKDTQYNGYEGDIFNGKFISLETVTSINKA